MSKSVSVMSKKHAEETKLEEVYPITDNDRYISKANAISQEEIHYLITKRKITN